MAAEEIEMRDTVFAEEWASHCSMEPNGRIGEVNVTNFQNGLLPHFP